MELPFWKDRDDNDDSKRGTRVHECGEALVPYALQDWDQEDPFFNAPNPLLDHEGKPYSEEEIEAGKLYCQDILRLVGNKVPRIAWVAEQRFTIDEELELGGTADFAWGYIMKISEFIKSPELQMMRMDGRFNSEIELPAKDVKIGHIWDYKNGTIPHFAPTSEQIKQYIAGLQHKLGSGDRRPFDIIFGHIYGPNFRERDKITSVVAYTKEEIEVILQEQRQIAEEALGLHGDGPLKLHAGEHCYFCKAKAVCPEFDRTTRERATTILGEYTPAVVTAKQPDPQELAKIDFDELLRSKSDEEIVSFFLWTEFFVKAANATKDYIRQRHLSGKPINGLRVVEGTTRRMYKKELDDLQIGEKARSWGVEKPWVKIARNLTEIEKELIKVLKGKGMKPKEATAEAAKKMDELCQQTTPSLAIIVDSESDPRPDVRLVNDKKAIEILSAVPVVKNSKTTKTK